jgi:hypothetical protein
MPFSRFEYEYSCPMNDTASTVDSPGEATPGPSKRGNLMKTAMVSSPRPGADVQHSAHEQLRRHDADVAHR